MPTMFTVICSHCGKEVKKSLKRINEAKKMGYAPVCSLQCQRDMRVTSVIKPCGYCGTIVKRTKAQQEKSKSGSIFCGHTCAAKYANAHKTIGTRRAKLEVFIENKIKELYPDLEIHFNKKDTINSELDIYIPGLKLAFELNGIFHYEPIYGKDKLDSIQTNDSRKFQACLEHGIELCIIDSSGHKRVNSKLIKII